MPGAGWEGTLASSGVRATNPGRQRPPPVGPPPPEMWALAAQGLAHRNEGTQPLPPGELSFICSPSQDTPLPAADPGPWDARGRAGPAHRAPDCRGSGRGRGRQRGQWSEDAGAQRAGLRLEGGRERLGAL